ncbi:tripartite motif-containing protein 10-like [Phaenicophaeus curvirostris]|uniref:tripartite motif-containing protein 10-like n=1 Tax=Phaenicophaeus curvirostris TaxID=33595 RepID=UPI0037F09F1E
MASGSSRARDGGEETARHAGILQHQLDPRHLGCDPTGCGGGTAPSQPKPGRPGDVEAVGPRRRLRRDNFQLKEQLEHLVEKLKLLGLEGGTGEQEQLCSWRKRTFPSKGGEKPSVSSCAGARNRGGPAATHQEESTHEDKERIHRDLEKLKKRREEMLELKMSGERRFQDYLTQTEVERRKIVSEFQQLRRFLKDQEFVLLVRLGELDREMMRRQEEEEAKISGQVSLLDILICETEKMLEEPWSRFPQGARGAVDRWETSSARKTTETVVDLEQRLRVISQQTKVLGEALGRFRETLPSELEKERGASPGGDGEAFVTLDPDTAHSHLVLSRDGRGARWRDAGREMPPTPQRFDVSCCVLGRGGFSSGRRSWLVEVAGSRTWALGVARCSVPRKTWLHFHPDKGIWALGRRGDRYQVFTSPVTTFPATGATGRVRVALDYRAGRVAFSLAGSEVPVFTFQNASFGGESVFPFFWLGRGTHLRLCP